MKQSLLISCFMLIFCLPLAGQTLTPEQLQTDFARFRTALNEVHPEMYRYTPKPTFDSLFAVAAAKLNQPMTRQEFYVAMIPLLVALRDGHIKWIVSGRDEHYPFATEKLFPLKLYFLGEKAWVTGNYGTGNVPAGAEIVSIDGQPIAAIIQKLLSVMTFADGNRVGGKYEDLNQYFSGYYATFIASPDTFEVVFKTRDGETKAALPAVTEAGIKTYVAKNKPTGQKPFRLTHKDSNTAVMTIERFWADKSDPDFSSFLKDSFREIKQKGIQNLVLDLRHNEGGEESWGVLLATYFAEKPFRYYDHIRVRQKKKYSFPVWTSKLYMKFRWLAVKKQGDGYVFTKQRGLKMQKPNRDAYHGNLYALINGTSFSVTSEFAARLHADRKSRSGGVTFVGQETGGGYKLDTSGLFAITQLPNSKIDLGIGMFGFHMANVSDYPHQGRGIIPDHPVDPTIDDILNRYDRIMEYALKLAQSQKSPLTKAE
ncbi:peptidase S41 [Spirosoma aureum]|uniref:Peptidase S41 n=1 Tax=Spirosoma aureum TaxID=2692134 RepID=A0A6G9AS91_9BACT|nr:S41 family peptidase [Spirosoma aureum]QIP15083.1 peptidase S41 [Spirosoma aureum]